MPTPESKVKAKVNRILSKYPNIYKFMPVQTGYGVPSLDYLLCIRGTFVAIETKKAGGKPTERQERTIKEILAAGGTTFVVCGEDDTSQLEEYLKDTHNDDHKPIPNK